MSDKKKDDSLYDGGTVVPLPQPSIQDLFKEKPVRSQGMLASKPRVLNDPAAEVLKKARKEVELDSYLIKRRKGELPLTPENQRKHKRQNELLDAAGCFGIDEIKALIAAGVDVNGKGRAGNTALIEAARGGSVENVKFLIAAGADVNAQNNRGITALMWASSEEVAAILRQTPSRFTAFCRRWLNFLR
jgi:hypothetical protein